MYIVTMWLLCVCNRNCYLAIGVWWAHFKRENELWLSSNCYTFVCSCMYVATCIVQNVDMELQVTYS